MSDIVFTAEDFYGSILEIQDGASGVYINLSSECSSFRLEDWQTVLDMFTMIATSKNIEHSVDKNNLKMSLDSK